MAEDNEKKKVRTPGIQFELAKKYGGADWTAHAEAFKKVWTNEKKRTALAKKFEIDAPSFEGDNYVVREGNLHAKFLSDGTVDCVAYIRKSVAFTVVLDKHQHKVKVHHGVRPCMVETLTQVERFFAALDVQMRLNPNAAYCPQDEEASTSPAFRTVQQLMAEARA